MWWDIIKSSRVAYKTFLQEIGPDVDLGTIPVRTEENLIIPKQKPHIVTDNFTIFGRGRRLVILSDTFKEETEFIQGMFNEEYPEREKEILMHIHSRGKTDGNITMETKYKILQESLQAAKERLKGFFMSVALGQVRPRLLDMPNNPELVSGVETDFPIYVADMWDYLPKHWMAESLRSKYRNYIDSIGDLYPLMGKQGMYQLAMTIITNVMVENILEHSHYFRNYTGNKEEIEGQLKDIIGSKLRSDITEDGEILELSQPGIGSIEMGRLALRILLGEE